MSNCEENPKRESETKLLYGFIPTTIFFRLSRLPFRQVAW